jgi:hypothetical protein
VLRRGIGESELLDLIWTVVIRLEREGEMSRRPA